MRDPEKHNLLNEIEELKSRLSEAEDTLNAIRKGEVDAIVVSGEDGDKIFSISSSETPYRIIIENMDEGAATISSSGIILYCNQRFADIINSSPEQIIGNEFSAFISQKDTPELNRLVRHSYSLPVRGELNLMSEPRTIRVSLSPLPDNIEGDICIIISDITEISKYQNYLREMVEERTGELRIANMHLHQDLEKIRETERALKESEMLFRSAFDESAVPMTLTSSPGKFVKVNRAFCKLTGYTEEELLEMNIKQIIYKEDVEITLKGMNDISTEKIASFQAEKRYTRKDGKKVWVSISIAPVQDEQGKLECFVTHIQNINKRKIAELRLKETKERFRQLANSIPQLAWIARPDGYIFWFNNRWYEYTGKTPEEMIGLGWKSVLHPDTLTIINQSWKYDIFAGKPAEMVSHIKGKDGNYREFLTKSIPITNENGSVEQWFGTHTDISELKKVENELMRSRERLNIALENGQIGIWEWNLHDNRLIWDERTEKMFGLSAGRFTGPYAAIENSIHEEDLPHLRNAVKSAFENGRVFETIIRTRRNSNYLSVKAIVARDDEGKVTGMSGVCFDITGMKKEVEQALIKINEELLRSNTDLQQFAYVASHDLQEPLRMVSSFTQLLQKKYHDKLGEDGNEYIHFAVEGSKRMYELLNGLLSYSRVQTKGKEFNVVDMNRVVHKVKENLSLISSEKKARIYSDNLPNVSADESQMIQLLQNLFENSLKFSQGTPKISVSCELDNNFYLFRVEDNGIGIEPQYYERIFRIFQRLHRSDQYGGTGIGLAICKRIVERHGGKIWVESAHGLGSTFFFSIPVTLPAV